MFQGLLGHPTTLNRSWPQRWSWECVWGGGDSHKLPENFRKQGAQAMKHMVSSLMTRHTCHCGFLRKLGLPVLGPSPVDCSAPITASFQHRIRCFVCFPRHQHDQEYVSVQVFATFLSVWRERPREHTGDSPEQPSGCQARGEWQQMHRTQVLEASGATQL